MTLDRAKQIVATRCSSLDFLDPQDVVAIFDGLGDEGEPEPDSDASEEA
jgi:hypothetical protein